jgi:hypothetical protein
MVALTTRFTYHIQQVFSSLLDQFLKLAYIKDPDGQKVFNGVNLLKGLFKGHFQHYQRQPPSGAQKQYQMVEKQVRTNASPTPTSPGAKS